MTYRHYLHENTNWVDIPKGTSPIFSHGYFHVTRKLPERIAIRIYEDDIWIKGIYVTFISLNDIIWEMKNENTFHWLQAKRIGKE